MVRGLATPPVDEAFVQDDRKELDLSEHAPYCQSRFLVLSSQPCGALEPLTSQTFELKEDWISKHESDVYQAASQAREEVRNRLNWSLEQGEASADRLESALSPWANTVTVPFYKEREEIWALLRTLRMNRSPLLMVLGFIAGSADGMLHGSLHRTFGIWRSLVGADRPDNLEINDFCNRAGQVIAGLASGGAVRHDGERVIPSTWAPDDFKDPAKPADPSLGCFMACLGPLLSVDIEQMVEEGLGERQLRWEVGPIPGRKGTPSLGGDTPAQRKGAFRRGIAIWNPIARDVIAEFFLAHEGPVATVGGLLGRPGWQLIHAASASEVLRQGTALLRSSHAEDLSSLSRYRRIIQCLYHLLIAGKLEGIELPGVDHDTFDHQSLFLPKRSLTRGIWASVILLRSIVERHSAWRLTRHWARSELRTAILTQHMLPGHQPRFVPMAAVETVLEEPLSSAAGSSAAEEAWYRLRESWKEALAELPPSLGGLRMWNIFLTNIANAAVDAEDSLMASFASEQLVTLHAILDAAAGPSAQKRKKSASAKGKLAIAEQPNCYNFSFEKTIADIKDAAGRPTSTLMVVQSALESKAVRFDLDHSLSSTSSDIATLVMGPASRYERLDADVRGSSTLVSKAAKILRAAMVELPLNHEHPADFLDGVDSMLSRHGSWLADVANKQSVDHFEERFKALLKAWVTFYTADSIRDMVGKSDGARGKSYGYVSSRYWRVAIRTTLALARLLSRSNAKNMIARQTWFGPGQIEDIVDWLLDHARSRCDILVRDTHVFDRERMFAMLVQVSVVRTMAGVARDRGRDEAVIRSRLDDAIGYLSAAERRYIQLGSPPALARRYYVERIATLCAWMRFVNRGGMGDELFQRVACLTVNDFDALDGHSAGNHYWEWLWRQRFEKFRKMCGELAIPVNRPGFSRHLRASN